MGSLVVSHPTVPTRDASAAPLASLLPPFQFSMWPAPPPQTTTSHRSLLGPQQPLSVQGQIGGDDRLPAKEGATKEIGGQGQEPPARPPAHAPSLTIAALGDGRRSLPDRKLPAPDPGHVLPPGCLLLLPCVAPSDFSPTPRMRIGAWLRHRAFPDARGLVAEPL